MKAHVQNPWTRSPSLMVNMSVEEVQQLVKALDHLVGYLPGAYDTNATDAAHQLARTLKHALETERPHGIKGVLP